VGSSNQISHNKYTEKRREEIMSKLRNLPLLVDTLKKNKGFREITDDNDLLYPENRQYFCETFDIDGLCPVFVDRSGMCILMLDDYGFMFKYDEMSRNLDYLGKNLEEGLTNYIYHPEKIYAIMEFTCELIPVRELEHQTVELLLAHGF
jgi:hypothetical protein